MALGEDRDNRLIGGELDLQRGRLHLASPSERGLVPWEGEFAQETDQGSGDFSLVQLWQTIVKHRVLIAACVALSLAGGAALTMLTKPIYTATTTLQIDRESAKIVNLQDVMPQEQVVSAEEFYQTQYGLLRSRSLADRVVENLGLHQSPAYRRAVGLEAKEPTLRELPDAPKVAKQDDRETVLRSVRANLGVSPVRGSRLVSVTFSSRDPEVSAKIANAFADNFISSNLERRFESSAYAREFLEKRIAQVKTKLEETERQLVAYAAAQQIIRLNDEDSGSAPGQTRSLDAANLEALNSSLAMAKADRIRAEQRWRQAQATSGLGLPEVLQSPTIQQLSQTRAAKSAEYQEKLKIFKPDFPAMVQLKAQIDETDRMIRSEAQTIRQSINSQYVSALNAERALAGQVEGLKSSVLDLRERSIQYNILQREVDTNRTLYDGLLQRYKEIGVTGGVTTNNVSVVDRAEPPADPSHPRPLLNMGLATVLGLGVGLLAAFLAEALDQAIRRPTDVEGKLGLPLLGTVPLLARGVTPGEATKDMRSSFWEAYHSIRTALQFSTADGVPRTMLITSSRPGEGKSTTSSTLARSLGRLGIRTLLVDADLRKPSLHTQLGIDGGIGLSNFLTGKMNLDQVVQVSGQPNLWVVASGPLPPIPAELLAGGRLNAFIEAASRRYDLVIFDGPPVMGLADAPMIASITEGTLLVIEAGKTGRNQVKAMVRRLHMAQGRLLGAVLTKFDAKKASYGYGTSYEYQYYYDYGPGGDAKKAVQTAG